MATLLGAATTIAAGLTAGAVGAAKMLISYMGERDKKFQETLTQVVNKFETTLREEREDRRRSVDLAMTAQRETVKVVARMDQAITSLKLAVEVLASQVDTMDTHKGKQGRAILPPHEEQ